MTEREEIIVRLAPLPRGYIRIISRDTASNPGSFTRILLDGSEEYITAIPRNSILKILK